LHSRKDNTVKALIFLGLAIATSAAAQATPPAQTAPASIAGTWTVRADVSGNQSESNCTFTQKEADLTGSCTSDRGTVTITGKVEGTTVNWQFDTQYEGQTLTVYYSGTPQSAEKLSGTINVQPMNVSGEFTATKAK
jgi:preprotein translocase subunit SecD